MLQENFSDSSGRRRARAAKQVACPLCDGSSVRLREAFDVEAVSTQWRKDFKIEVADEFRDCSEFHLYECLECAVLFFVPRSVAGSPALYEQLEKQENYYSLEKWEHAVALEDLRGLSSVLEVGCGFGSFVARARSQGIDGIEGIEMNASAVDVAVRQGLRVRGLDIDAVADASPGKYDAVCAFQVLEHVPDPKSFLASACSLVRAGGKLIFGVPNADSFLRHLDPILLDMPPHHMTRWPPEALRRLTNSFPLRLERMMFEPLADQHMEMYLEAQGCRVAGRGMKLRPLQKLRVLLARMLRATGMNRFLRGHTVYACYSKI